MARALAVTVFDEFVFDVTICRSHRQTRVVLWTRAPQHPFDNRIPVIASVSPFPEIDSVCRRVLEPITILRQVWWIFIGRRCKACVLLSGCAVRSSFCLVLAVDGRESFVEY